MSEPLQMAIQAYNEAALIYNEQRKMFAEMLTKSNEMGKLMAIHDELVPSIFKMKDLLAQNAKQLVELSEKLTTLGIWVGGDQGFDPKTYMGLDDNDLIQIEVFPLAQEITAMA